MQATTVARLAAVIPAPADMDPVESFWPGGQPMQDRGRQWLITAPDVSCGAVAAISSRCRSSASQVSTGSSLLGGA